MGARVVKWKNARVFMEGQEVCREYVKTENVTFGTSTLLPGQTGAVDPGHPDGQEIFFVSRGHVIVHIPSEGSYYELFESDAIIISERQPHQLMNVGTEPAVVTWSLVRCS